MCRVGRNVALHAPSTASSCAFMISARPLETEYSWQQAKYAKLYSDPLRSAKERSYDSSGLEAKAWASKRTASSAWLRKQEESQCLHQSLQSSLRRAVKTTLKMTVTFILSHPLPKCSRSFTLMENGSLKAEDSSDEMNGTGIIGVLV